MSVLKRIFGDEEEKKVYKAMKFADTVLSKEDTMGKLDRTDFRIKTDLLRKKYCGKDEIEENDLAEIFALVREAAWRVLGIKHYKVQIAGAYLLFHCGVTEMATGEGKTLVSTMPAYARAVLGEKVHIVTVNEYLVKRDSEQMGEVFKYLGMTTGAIYGKLEDREERKAQYECDILYGTISEFGFDYLKDNLAKNLNDVVQKSLDYIIVDEIDSILIDEARTPLIISNRVSFDQGLFIKVSEFVNGLRYTTLDSIDARRDKNEYGEADYIVDKKHQTAFLTEKGIKKAEEHFGVEGLNEQGNDKLVSYLNLSIKAYGVLARDVDYVVKDGEVQIVDENTGRLMYGRKYSDGLHQSLEAKEGIEVSGETRAVAKITLQNLFKCYKHGSGMTGTAYTESTEFYEMYGLDVYRIPTNKKMIRVDHLDQVYTTREGKLKAILNTVEHEHAFNRPILIGTMSVEKNREISELLTERGIKHEVLNAVDNEREAEIIAMAGRSGSVTVATNMAGRGTDIILGGNPVVLARMRMEELGYNTEDIESVEEVYRMPEGIDKVREMLRIERQDGKEKVEVLNKYVSIIEECKKECKSMSDYVIGMDGLVVIGTERHDSRRVDNQLRGRAGRQGEPGESMFFLSMEDDLLKMFGAKNMMDVVQVMEFPDNEPIEFKMLTRLIEMAQKKVENLHFTIRKQVMEYDNVINGQRTKIYEQRKRVLAGENIKESIINMGCDMCLSVAEGSCTELGFLDKDAFEQALVKYGGKLFDVSVKEKVSDDTTCEELSELLSESFKQLYEKNEESLGFSDMRSMERVVLLMKADKFWIDHIDAMNELSNGMHLRALGGLNPITEYIKEGNSMYADMLDNIKEETIATIMSMTRRIRG